MTGRHLLLTSALALASCSDGAQETVVNVSVIGGRPAVVNPDRSLPTAAASALLQSTAQGLVRLDETGRIVPGLAERWIVTDDGLSLIFRIRHVKWADGREVTSAEVAEDLRQLVGSSNRLAPYFSGIEKISPMTGRVLEIRFAAPQPHVLALLAQPEAAVMRRTIGTGPLRLVSSKGGVFRLQRSAEDAERMKRGKDAVALRGDDAGRAVARYMGGGAHLVAGGSFADLAFARAARRPGSELRLEPVTGLLGLTLAPGTPFLKSPEVRAALSMSLDRERLLKLFNVPGWRQAVSIVPQQFDLPAPPAAQDWVPLGLDERVSRAAGLIANWRAKGGVLPVLRVAVPRGPGGELMLAAIRADWAKLGLQLVSAGTGPADVRLIDEIAPQPSAAWYLARLSCARGNPCSDKGEGALKAARSAASPAERAIKLAEADAAFAVNTPFIPIAVPLRWSLVSPDLAGWRENALAAHPMDGLVAVAR